MFYPQPIVDSAVVNITMNKKYQEIDRAKFYNFVKVCFSMRRKTLLNNLSSGLKLNKEELTKKLSNFDLTKRAESLNLQELIELYKHIF